MLASHDGPLAGRPSVENMKALIFLILFVVIFAGGVLLIQHVSTVLGVLVILIGASPVLLILVALIVRRFDREE